MTTADTYKSAIGSVIGRYVALKRALGRAFQKDGYVLLQLDRYLAKNNVPDLTLTSFIGWSRDIEHMAPGERRERLRVVYRFCQFRRREDPGAFVPDPDQFPQARPRPIPYIFSHAEILRLLEVTNRLKAQPQSPLYPQIARVSVVLLYTAGLRRGEIVRLVLGDYERREGLLLVRDTKFHKSRLLPLSDDATREMESYMEARGRPPFPGDADSPLLFNGFRSSAGYSHGGFGLMMRRLFRNAKILTRTGRTPRTHDLRFTFAVHALLRWYRSGADVSSRLPILSRYMGHVSVVSTQYYLSLLGTVAEAANVKFERHCDRFLTAGDHEGGKP
jgi:integrase/recombinase XerD